MASADSTNILDMSLEDMIKTDKKLRTSHPKPSSDNKSDRGRNDKRNRSTPYSRQKPRRNGNSDEQWTHDLFNEGTPAATANPRSNDTSTFRKIQVENLHYEVSQQDLEELFTTVGAVKKVNIVYDNAGRSTGVAKIQFETPAHAAQAIQQYNNVTLDGKPMKIGYAPGGRGSSASQPSIMSRLGGVSRNGTRKPANNRPRGAQRRGDRRSGQSEPRGKREPASKDDLDAELESYMQVDNGVTMQE
ncbi:RNA-binding domain-containing protein [Basidiobolus meristosporus CBS 931.73]|uniref:RNA-binding domain-containing protein n=1 Tax=Basidiobolus meristosporus CBS 931.73 TaxID=1314790 RepID=A0A1Y1XUJ9_9FUNG|nr:RNA-binding domain-containing protein [Basidiobolus meristosporus CBS 931.73]|eukprot:ORX89447.1 RNA-binding domain-containing protein [Basidiobolus meristosporus CBS 931.73]